MTKRMMGDSSEGKSISAATVGNTRSSPSTTLKGMKDPVKSKEADTKSDSGSDYDDMLICMVCDRAFTTARQLLQHQISRKHLMCSSCEQPFESPEQLKEHKDHEHHWSDTDDIDSEEKKACSEDDDDDVSQSFSEIERLL